MKRLYSIAILVATPALYLQAAKPVDPKAEIGQASSSSSSSSDHYEANLYLGKPITEQVILDQQAPTRVAATVAEFMTQHHDIFNAIVTAPVTGTRDERRARIEAINKQLAERGLNNLSNSNYTFAITVNDQPWMFKMAGMPNRRENYNAAYRDLVCQTPEDKKARRYGQDVTQDELDTLRNNHGVTRTYQTASRVAINLKVKEWLDQNPNSKIVAPKSYIFRIPDTVVRGSNDLSDFRYAVVEPKIDGKAVETDPQAVLDAEQDIRAVIQHAGLWEVGGKNMLITPERKVALFDFEQPNNSNPADFFHKNQAKVAWNTKVGLGDDAGAKNEGSWTTTREQLQKLLAERSTPTSTSSSSLLRSTSPVAK